MWGKDGSKPLKKQKRKRLIIKYLRFLFSDSGGIQTHNLLIRSQMLYSVELRNPLWLLFYSDLR